MRSIHDLTDAERAQLRQQVFRLYEEAEAEIRSHAPVCVASGKCCRFADYGHTLFLSHLEAQALLHTAPPYTRPTNRNFCPFQVELLCTARHERPLGCRVYYCDPSYAGKGEAITEKYLAQLKSLSNTWDLGWHYAPLHDFLDQGRTGEMK